MSAILFRPQVLPLDQDLWAPALQEIFKDRDFRITPDIGNPEDVHYLINWRLEKGDRDKWPNLKAILSLSAGVNQYVGYKEMPDNVDLIRMIEPGLARDMAEHVSSFVLRFHRQHGYYQRSMNKGEFLTGLPVKQAPQRRIGFMGLGEMSRACIDMLRPFGFQINGWSKNKHNIEGVSCFATEDERLEFLKQTDILVCLLPLTDETKNILNIDLFNQLPRGAYIINAARGKHLVENDLLQALETGQLSAAAIDVFYKEPPPENHPFRNHPRICVTPHIAAITQIDSGAIALKQAIDDIESGQRPAGWVDLNQGY